MAIPRFHPAALELADLRDDLTAIGTEVFKLRDRAAERLNSLNRPEREREPVRLDANRRRQRG